MGSSTSIQSSTTHITENLTNSQNIINPIIHQDNNNSIDTKESENNQNNVEDYRWLVKRVSKRRKLVIYIRKPSTPCQQENELFEASDNI